MHGFMVPTKIKENVTFHNMNITVNITQITFAVFLFGHFDSTVC
jgi:hypothetical protein